MNAVIFMPAILVVVTGFYHFYLAFNQFNAVAVMLGVLFVLVSAMMLEEDIKTLENA